MRKLFLLLFISFVFLFSSKIVIAQDKWFEHISEEESSPRLIPIDDETFFLFTYLDGFTYQYKYNIYGEQLWRKQFAPMRVRDIIPLENNEFVIRGNDWDHTIIQYIDNEGEFVWEYVCDYFNFGDKIFQINNEYWLFTSVEDLGETDEDWLYIHRLNSNGELIGIEMDLPLHKSGTKRTIDNNSKVLCKNYDDELDLWQTIIVDQNANVIIENDELTSVSINNVLEDGNDLVFLAGSANADYPDHVVLRKYSYELEHHWSYPITEYGYPGIGSYSFDKIILAHNGGYILAGSVTDVLGQYPFMIKTGQNGVQDWFVFYEYVATQRIRDIISTVDGGYISAQTNWGGDYADIWLVKSDGNGNLLATEEIIKNNIRISPNPAIDYITLQADNKEIKRLYIYDLQGRLIKTFEYSQFYYISDLPKGMYVLKIETTQGLMRSSKLIKQ